MCRNVRKCAVFIILAICAMLFAPRVSLATQMGSDYMISPGDDSFGASDSDRIEEYEEENGYRDKRTPQATPVVNENGAIDIIKTAENALVDDEDSDEPSFGEKVTSGLSDFFFKNLPFIILIGVLALALLIANAKTKAAGGGKRKDSLKNIE